MEGVGLPISIDGININNLQSNQKPGQVGPPGPSSRPQAPQPPELDGQPPHEYMQ